jgi:CheY-like chemotaxis protein
MLSERKFQAVPICDVPKDDARFSAERGPVALVVDDERIVADTLAIILRKSGFSAVAAYDGLSALNLAKEIWPQLVISDVVMPKMTGIELAIALKEILPSCKVLLFSGQGSTADLLRKAKDAGHDLATLDKPIHPSDLLRVAKGYFPEEEFPEMPVVSHAAWRTASRPEGSDSLRSE